MYGKPQRQKDVPDSRKACVMAGRLGSASSSEVIGFVIKASSLKK